MNKKLIALTCILALITLSVAIIFLRPNQNTNADTTGETYANSEGMAYYYTAPRRISPSRARVMMQNYPHAIILDVRTQQEFDTERIPGAILLPDYAVSDLAEEVLPDLDALILVYCRTGRRSQSAARILADMGYTNVYDFGGLESWPYERE